MAIITEINVSYLICYLINHRTPQVLLRDRTVVPRTKINNSKAAPIVWNSLPMDVSAQMSLVSTKVVLKTYLFRKNSSAS